MSSSVSAAYLLFFNDTAPPEIYTLSLHDALPIWPRRWSAVAAPAERRPAGDSPLPRTVPGSSAPSGSRDRKSTRLNSSHQIISYAVFCLKKKKKQAAYRECEGRLEDQRKSHSTNG